MLQISQLFCDIWIARYFAHKVRTACDPLSSEFTKLLKDGREVLRCPNTCVQIDKENEAEEAASKLPLTKGDVIRDGDVRDGQPSTLANGKHLPQPARLGEGQSDGGHASGVSGQTTIGDKFDSGSQLQRSSSQRRSLFRDSFRVHTPQYAADCGSIEEPDPSSPRGIDRISAARTDSRKSLGRSASLSRDRSLSGSFKRSAKRS